MLARVGVGKLKLVDGGKFKEENLNRQLFSGEGCLGMNKAEVVGSRLQEINSATVVVPIPEFLTESNAAELMTGVDVVIDALDSLPARLLLEEKARKFNLPLVHGAVGGIIAQVAVIFPEDKGFANIYKVGRQSTGLETKLGNVAPIVTAVAALEVYEVIKILTSCGEPLRNRLLFLNFWEEKFEIIPL
jgi:molybdopterin/thiamine biosynthesis adenylyltransferase